LYNVNGLRGRRRQRSATRRETQEKVEGRERAEKEWNGTWKTGPEAADANLTFLRTSSHSCREFTFMPEALKSCDSPVRNPAPC
jgi:hypothetical protein